MNFSCSACGELLGDVVFSILNLPLVDSFENTIEMSLGVPKFSVNIRQCTSCLTVQLDELVDLQKIYKNYIYESSSSPDLSNHFQSFAEDLKNKYNTNSSILEIGLNDGLFLNECHKLGFCNLTGIDPSPQSKKIVNKNIKVINDFFSPGIRDSFESKFDLIIANNCFSHIPDLLSVLLECNEILVDNGTLIVEVQSLLDLFENSVFDYIYHEHIFYHSLTSFSKLCDKAGLEVYDIVHVNTKGGSYRFFISKKDVMKVSSSVKFWSYREQLSDIHNLVVWDRLSNYLCLVKSDLNDRINSNNCKFLGYGASATGTVLMRYMDLEKHISYIIDDNPKRQGLFSPGTTIPVISLHDGINLNMPFLILSWRHIFPISKKINTTHQQKIVPLPYPYSFK